MVITKGKKTKTTDGPCSVCNPDSVTLILSSLQECPHRVVDLTNDRSDLNPPDLGIAKWLSECCVTK